MQKNLLLLISMVVYFSPVFSQQLYSNTIQVGDYFTPGIGASQTPIITFDDVLIPSTDVQGTDSISITNVKFGITRLANAPAVTVNFYYTVKEDTATFTRNLIRIPPVRIGAINFLANGATSVTSIVSLGDSINTLFKVKTDTGNFVQNYQTIFLGLSFSDSTTGRNGWELVERFGPSANLNLFWEYDVDNSTSRNAYSFNGVNAPVATFYLEVFGKGLTPLPVTVAQFSARRSGNVNLLNWSTQQEVNSDYFVIERSIDGSNFSKIGQVTAAGNSSTVRSYSFTDLNPEKGNNYYRFRIVDRDNLSKLSETRRIRNEGMADVRMYPNPVIDKLNVEINVDLAADGFMTVTDLSGKIIYTRSLRLPQGNSIIPVRLNSMAAGAYILKIQLNDDVIIKKFNKL